MSSHQWVFAGLAFGRRPGVTWSTKAASTAENLCRFRVAKRGKDNGVRGWNPVCLRQDIRIFRVCGPKRRYGRPLPINGKVHQDNPQGKLGTMSEHESRPRSDP